MRKEVEQVLGLVESALSEVAKAQAVLNVDEKTEVESDSGPIVVGVNELISRLQMELGIARSGLTSARDFAYSITCHHFKDR